MDPGSVPCPHHCQGQAIATGLLNFEATTGLGAADARDHIQSNEGTRGWKGMLGLRAARPQNRFFRGRLGILEVTTSGRVLTCRSTSESSVRNRRRQLPSRMGKQARERESQVSFVCGPWFDQLRIFLHKLKVG